MIKLILNNEKSEMEGNFKFKKEPIWIDGNRTLTKLSFSIDIEKSKNIKSIDNKIIAEKLKNDFLEFCNDDLFKS